MKWKLAKMGTDLELCVGLVTPDSALHRLSTAHSWTPQQFQLALGCFGMLLAFPKRSKLLARLSTIRRAIAALSRTLKSNRQDARGNGRSVQTHPAQHYYSCRLQAEQSEARLFLGMAQQAGANCPISTESFCPNNS